MNIAKYLASTAIVGSLLLLPAMAFAQETEPPDSLNEALLKRLEQMELELKNLKSQLQQANETAETAVNKADEAVQTADAAENKAKAAANSKNSYNGPIPDTKWHLSGYADTSLVVTDSDEMVDTFSSGKFNPAFHFQYKDLVIFESEAEISVDSEGETEFELEYSQFDILLHDNATLVVGKYLSPVGQFQERLHPSWINKSVNAPAGFGHDGIQPATDVGAQIRGGVPIGKSTLTYVVAVGNGPRMGHEGGIELEGFGGDDNGNKAVSGRLGFLPLPYFEAGASFLTAKVDGLEGIGMFEPTRADFSLWGADAAYTRGPWDVRFEYLNGERDSIFSAHEEGGEIESLPQLNMEAWYAQIAYRLSGLTDSPVLQNFEPVFRYGEFNIDGNEELEEENAEKRFNIGLNYWLAPSIVARGGIEWRNFQVPDKETETRFHLQFAYGF